MNNDTETTNTDPFHGQGGSYVIDGASQTRRLVERTSEVAVPQEVPEAKAPAPDPLE